MEKKKTILVINGPNINMLGVREPEIYGTGTYEDLLRMIRGAGEEIGVEIETFQSNHEGAIVDRIQEAYGKADGLVINPAGYTHTSVAIPDAIKAVGIPTVEVHISDVDSREAFRQRSFVSPVAVKTIKGKGLEGYREAVLFLDRHLRSAVTDGPDERREENRADGSGELTTDRLVLRRYIPEDALPLHESFGLDPEMFRYSGWNPYATREAAEETVRRFMDSYDDDHFYGWAIVREGELIGTIGAYDYDPEGESIEIGCSIRRANWGNGFASEAVKAVIAYLTEREGIRSVKAWCAAENTGSRKVMERAGMAFAGTEKGALEIDGRKYDKENYITTV